jgi:hypothetical protein
MQMLVLGVVMAVLAGGLAVIWTMIAGHAAQIGAALRGEGVAPSAAGAPVSSARILRFERRKAVAPRERRLIRPAGSDLPLAA